MNGSLTGKKKAAKVKAVQQQRAASATEGQFDASTATREPAIANGVTEALVRWASGLTVSARLRRFRF